MPAPPDDPPNRWPSDDEVLARAFEIIRKRRAEEAEMAAALDMPLQPITKRAKVSSDNMTDQHRIALSKSRGKGRDRFLPHIRAAGYTLRSLAAAIDVSQPTLSAHRMPKSNPNHRPCPEARAKLVEKLTKWPADAAHWPAGITS